MAKLPKLPIELKWLPPKAFVPEELTLNAFDPIFCRDEPVQFLSKEKAEMAQYLLKLKMGWTDEEYNRCVLSERIINSKRVRYWAIALKGVEK